MINRTIYVSKKFRCIDEDCDGIADDQDEWRWVANRPTSFGLCLNCFNDRRYEEERWSDWDQ